MSLKTLGWLSTRLHRIKRIEAAANRIFVALREETKHCAVTNDDIAQLWNVSDALATAIVDGGAETEAMEEAIVARARATLAADLDTPADLPNAIARVGERIDQLVR